MKSQVSSTTVERRGHTYLQWIFASIANLCTLVYGMEVGWISPMTKILQSESSPLGYPLSDFTMVWVASSTCISAGFGVIIYSLLVDRYGRKLSIQALLLPQFISFGLRLFSPTLSALFLARILAGLAAGGCFILVPLYVKEISQQSLTGILVTLQVFYQNIGILAMYIIGIYLEYYTILWIASVLPVLALAMMAIAPESPAFLVKEDKIDEATNVLSTLRGLECTNKIIENEIHCMVQQETEFRSLPDISLITIVQDKSWRRGVIVVLILFSIQAWNGAYAIITYASPILASTGVEFNIEPEFQTLSFPIIMIFASLLLTVVVEKFGRKILLTGAFLISTLALFALSTAMVVQLYGGLVPNWLPVISMMLTVAMYTGGICPLTYIITTEMFVFQVRAKIMGIACSYAWVAFFVPLVIYAPITNTFGIHTSFIIFGLMNALGVIFTLVMIPETKGKSDEEIRRALTGHKNKILFNDKTHQMREQN